MSEYLLLWGPGPKCCSNVVLSAVFLTGVCADGRVLCYGKSAAFSLKDLPVLPALISRRLRTLSFLKGVRDTPRVLSAAATSASPAPAHVCGRSSRGGDAGVPEAPGHVVLPFQRQRKLVSSSPKAIVFVQSPIFPQSLPAPDLAWGPSGSCLPVAHFWIACR